MSEEKGIQSVESPLDNDEAKDSSEPKVEGEKKSIDGSGSVARVASTRKRRALIAVAAVIVVCLTLVGSGTAFGWLNPATFLQTTQEVIDEGSSDNSDESETIDKQDTQSGEEKTVSEQDITASTPEVEDTQEASTEIPPTPDSATAVPTPPAASAPVPPEESNPQAPATITVSVYVDSSRASSYGYPASMASTSVILPVGSSVFDALCATGVSVGGDGSYISSIGGLSEGMKGLPGSGWLYFVNGVSPGYGSSSFPLKGSESITWVYTLDTGNDI